MIQQVFHEIVLKTNGQGFYDFTDRTLDWLKKQKIKNGILNINILHSQMHNALLLATTSTKTTV